MAKGEYWMEEEKKGLSPESGMDESVLDRTVSDSSIEEASVQAEERAAEGERLPVAEEKQPEAPEMESVQPEAPRMESVQPETPRMESVQPETPRMESFQSPQSPAENAQGPWQGGYGDTRDTASPPKKSGNGMSIASLVMGILSLVCCCCGYVGIALGALGIIFALLSRQDEPMNTQAKVGLILACVGIALNVISIILLLVMNAAGLVDVTTDVATRIGGR